MTDFFNWLIGGSPSAIAFIVIFIFTLGSVILIYAAAFFQGREISFWPPKIGKRPERSRQENDESSVPTGETVPCTATVFENYRKVDWDCLLSKSRSVDMAVSFFASWAKAHWENLLGFYRRGGRIRLILTDPNAEAIDTAWKRFPRYENRKDFVQRIEDTVKNFQLALQESKSNTGSFEVFYFNEALNYAIIRVDDRKLFLSFYEHTNRTRIGAPSILLDLETSPALRDYWTEEFETLLKKSQQIDPRQYVKHAPPSIE